MLALGDPGGPRLAVLDDGLFVRTYAGEVRPISATFNRFVEAVARSRSFAHVRYVVPVRDLRIWEAEPALDPVDESVVEIVPTTFFSGIADYLLRAAYVAGRNWRPIDRAIAESDLLWLRLPASNALLALATARLRGVPHFGWVAGSVAAVAGAGRRPLPASIAAQAVGRAYDAVTRLAGEGGPLITLDVELFASTVTASEIAETRARPAPEPSTRPLRIVWAGRMAAEKGLLDLIDTVSALRANGRDVMLVLMGDGPARRSVERALAALPDDRVEDYGYVGDRATYMDILRSGDLFVHPSIAEGVPKALVEAMAAGTVIVATEAGAVREVLGDDGERGRVVSIGDREDLARAVGQLLDEDELRSAIRERALVWAADHTAEAQARRLIERLRIEFPDLGWTH